MALSVNVELSVAITQRPVLPFGAYFARANNDARESSAPAPLTVTGKNKSLARNHKLALERPPIWASGTIRRMVEMT
jgi:hypothetical protein